MSRLRRLASRLLAERMDPDEIHAFDEDLVHLLAPLVGAMERYFRAEVHGLENIPRGPALIVGNHNAGITFLEPFVFGKKYLEHTGRLDIHSLGHDALWRIPALNNALQMVGAVRASHDNAHRVFQQGRKVAVWPGGAYEAFRPWPERHRVDFGGHRGFVRLAFRHGVDIVPLLCLGGHDAFLVLRRGERLARAIGAPRWLRTRSWPVFLAPPWGLMVGPMFHLPLPAKVVVEAGPPIDLSQYRPEDADDPERVQEVYTRTVDTLQQMMDRRVAELRRQRRALVDLWRERLADRVAPALPSADGPSSRG